MANEFLPSGLVKGRLHPIDIGYIVLNPKLPREEYVQSCLRNNAVDVMLTDGTYYDQCMLASVALSQTDGERIAPKFPSEKGVLGSAVLLVFAYASNKPIVLAFLPTLEDFMVLDHEDQSKSLRTSEGNCISIVRDPKIGKLVTTVQSTTEQQAELQTHVTAPNDTGLFFVHVAGTVKHFATKLIHWLTASEFVLQVRNLVNQEKYTKVRIKLGEKAEIVDEFDNSVLLDTNGLTVVSPAHLNVTLQGNCTVTISGTAKINVSGKAEVNCGHDVDVVATGNMKLDAAKINIGNAASLTLNVDTICQYTGQKHLPPPTNIKTSN
jgi:hypothetical protein